MLPQIETLFHFSSCAEDESLETILAACYRIARARAKQVKQTARDEGLLTSRDESTSAGARRLAEDNTQGAKSEVSDDKSQTSLQ